MGNEIKQYFKKIALSFLCATVVFEGVAASSLPVLAYDDETTLFDAEEEILLDTDEETSEDEIIEDEIIEDEVTEEAIEDEEATFEDAGSCGEGVYWGLDLTTGELNIFGEGAMEDNTIYSTEWYPVRNFIRKVVIKEGVTYIGEEAFRGEEYLEELEIASSVKTIGKKAFQYTSLVESDRYELPEGIETIADYAFADSYIADEVVVPESVKTVGKGSFSRLRQSHSVKKLVFLGDMPEFGDKALTGNVCVIYYPGDNKTWTEEKVKALAEENQADIRPYVSDTPTSGKCGDNITWEVTGDEEKILELRGSGDMYDYSPTNIAPWLMFSGKISQVVIEPEITSIGAYAFYDMNFVWHQTDKETIVLPKTLKAIGDYAFAYVTSRTIVLPESVAYIGSHSFVSCRVASEKTDLLPKGIKEIGDYAFYHSYLTNGTLILPETVEKLGERAFDSRTSYSFFYILGNRPEIGETVLGTGRNVTVYYPADNATWADFNSKDYDLGGKYITYKALAKHTVTFVDPYGNTIPVNCYDKACVSEPEIALKAGDEILGWYMDNGEYPGFQTSRYRWKFTNKVTSDMKLTARLKGTDCKVKFVTNCDTELPDQIVAAGEKIAEPGELSREGYDYYYWSTIWIAFGNNSFDFDQELKEDLILYAIWNKNEKPSSMFSADYAVYTGKPVCPKVTVTIDGQVLEKDKDYTIKYFNNIKAGEGKYTVTLKGNYTGKVTGEFTIARVNLENNPNVWVTDEVVTFPYDGKKHSAKTKVKAILDGKEVTLKENVDYEYYYNFEDEDYIYPGVNEVVIQGKGNFKGEISFKQVITNDVLLSKATVSKIPAATYTGEEIKPSLTVKYKNKALKENEHYTVTYENNVEAGTATAILQAVPGSGFAGSKRVTFAIAGTQLSKATVTGLDKKTYDGKEKTLDGLKLTVKGSDKKVTELKGMEESSYLEIKGTDAAKEVDYIYRYENNVNAGKASVVMTGVNGCQGTVTKTFVIAPKDVDEGITATVSGNATFDKAGARPEITVTYNNGDTEEVLTEGTDYTVKLGGNKKLGKAKAKATITLKGNFKGKLVKEFEVVKADIADFSVVAEDVVVNAKAGINAPAITVTDKAGNKLTAGKDYDKKVVYKYADSGKEVSASDSVAAGTRLYAEIAGIGAYQGTAVSNEFAVVNKTIATAKVTVTPKYYSTRGVELKKSEIKVTVGKDILTEDDYDIVGYENNHKAGKATVILKGKGNYGGTVKATFVIKNVKIK